MPFGPANSDQGFRRLIVDSIIANIDVTLLNPPRARNYVQGEPNDCVYTFTFRDQLTEAEQNYLSDLYMAPSVGWGAIQVKNGTQGVTVKLFLKPDSRHRS